MEKVAGVAIKELKKMYLCPCCFCREDAKKKHSGVFAAVSMASSY
jgi:hypothetical protein